MFYALSTFMLIEPSFHSTAGASTFSDAGAKLTESASVWEAMYSEKDLRESSIS